jgi:CubicO group peptidase (beta-lactamase class C family)
VSSWFGFMNASSSRRPLMDGFVHQAFLPVEEALAGQLRAYLGGAAVCMYQHGVCVADLWGGYRDDEGHRWERDTMSPSFSTTKGLASTVAHVLVDSGFLDATCASAAKSPAWWAPAGKAKTQPSGAGSGAG